jgi:hypothetical protein
MWRTAKRRPPAERLAGMLWSAVPAAGRHRCTVSITRWFGRKKARPWVAIAGIMGSATHAPSSTRFRSKTAASTRF